MKIKLKTLLLFALLIGAFSPHPAAAKDKSVVMPSRTGEITIRPDGKVDVCEIWAVQFIGGPFKYARRTIPLNKVEAIENWRVSENGQPYQFQKGGAPNTYQVTTENNQQIAIWYFPPTTDQERTFEVCYTLVGALRIGATQDEFYWKFIEPERSYPVEAVQVKLHLPKTFTPSEVEASTYVNGSQKDGALVDDGSSVTFTGGPINPNQEWELRVVFPHGAVSAAPPAWQTGAQSNAGRPSAAQSPALTFEGVIFGLGLVAVIVLVVLVIVFSRKYQIMKRTYGWLLIVLGFVVFIPGTILGNNLGLPSYLVLTAAGVGFLICIVGGVGLGQRSGGRGGSSYWGGGGGHWGGSGGGDSGGGGGGGGSDFG